MLRRTQHERLRSSVLDEIIANMATNDKNYFDPKVLAGIANLGLRARWVVEGLMSGVHKSRAKGFSVEFEEHREYSPGDEIRRIEKSRESRATS